MERVLGPLEASPLRWLEADSSADDVPGIELALPQGWRSDEAAPRLWIEAQPSPAIVDAIEAIHARSERRSPTAPVPEPVGQLLFMLARALKPRQVLDVGSGAGASLLWLAAGLGLEGSGSGASLVGVERDSAMRNLARKALRQVGLEERVGLELGELERLADKLRERAGRGFELVFLDEGLEDRVERFEVLLPALAPSALVIAHGGRGEAGAAAQFNAHVQLHPRIRSSLRVAMGRGVSLLRLG